MSGAMLLKKRERTQNWVPEEKNALFSLIKSHVNEIENKKIDAAASAMKTIAWQQIHSAFAGKFSTDRDITRMREQWRRMKAQSRIEMHNFAEKVRTLGPEEAFKCRPSSLSIEVWRLLENARRIDSEADRSDESSQENSSSLRAILQKLVEANPESSTAEIKVEPASDTFNTEDETSHTEISTNTIEDRRTKRARNESKPMDLADAKTTLNDRQYTGEENYDTPNESSSKFEERSDRAENREELIEKSMWMFEATQREHDIRLRKLNIELECAEMQRQAAINELKTSEIKRQLMENQAMEYYSQIRMSGERGSGAGKGGGGGGSIRDAGGSFGKMEAAHEDQYFYNQQKQQIQKLRESLHDEISFHEEQIKRHQEAINRHKKRIDDMEGDK